ALFSDLRSRYAYIRARNSTVYTLVNTLVEAGWLRSKARDADRQVFQLTPAGRQALAERVGHELRDGALSDRTAFMTALAYLGILAPAEAAAALQGRVDRIHREEERLASALDKAGSIPELHMIETHYYRNQLDHERSWLEATIRRIRSGSLAWPRRTN
ncbi:MAG: helix-turn-helix transcriptional regulator, partial [Humibacter sp.]